MIAIQVIVVMPICVPSEQVWTINTSFLKDICNRLLHELCQQRCRFELDTSIWRKFLKYHIEIEMAILDNASSYKITLDDLQPCRERRKPPKLDPW